ncbi:MAG: hypothetical protein Q7S33_00945 [Nanoarchaeota archaeon]|nr:hypothetical protein [Nanoarchaeota archaeon]
MKMTFRLLRPLGYRKNAISEIVAYAILIAITLSLAGLVYGWLKFYATPNEKVECPDGIGLIIKGYQWSGGVFSVTVQNKGFFNITGFIAKVNPSADATIGIYTLSTDGTEGGIDGTSLSPNDGEKAIPYKYSTDGISYVALDKSRLVDGSNLGFLEIQPYIVDSKTHTKVFCSQIVSQRLTIMP